MGLTTKIIGTGSYLPDDVLTSSELAERLGIEEQWILDKTGIKERHIAHSEEVTSDLAARAAEQALAAAKIPATDVDVLIVATVTPDQPIPATACFVQDKIGATNATAFDIAAGCSGFVFALSMAHDMLVANPERNTALVIGAEVFSRFVDYSDKKTCILFGDGAGAAVVRKTSGELGMIATSTRSDGAKAEIAYIRAGGARVPASAETVEARDHYLRLNGREIREVVTGSLSGLVSELLEKAKISIDDVSLIVPHQLNGVMLDQWPSMLGTREDAVYRTVSWSGNTAAASISIALDDAVRKGNVSNGDIVMLLAFGAGLTLGGAVLEW